MYPAPYRVDLIHRFASDFEVDTFFETFGGSGRNNEWFRQGDYYVLEDKEGRRRFNNIDFSSYDAALAFEYSTKEGAKLVLNCIKHKLPYFINCDGVMLGHRSNCLKDLFKRFLIKGAVGYLAGGEYAKNYFLKFGADEKKIYIHHFSELDDNDILQTPLSPEEKASLRVKKGLPADKRIVIAVGRFIPLKRYDCLLKAWRSMPEDIVLLLIGGGSMLEEYTAIIKQYDLKNVIIKGFEKKESLFDYYKAADVFVHPTSFDAWGLVVNEAMACGLPVVVSDYCVAGLELVKNGKNGYIVPMGEDALMCERVREVLDDDDYPVLCRNALDTIRPFTIDNMARIQINAIKETLEG